jgi:CheY-like chemotaxis protein
MAAKRILIVDDEEMVRMVMRMVLTSAGFEVSEAPDGEDALRQLAQPGSSFDLVLLDQNMPKMNGRETLARMRREMPAPKVVLLSGVVSGDLEQAVADAGVRLLSKPFQNQELVQVVQEVLYD